MLKSLPPIPNTKDLLNSDDEYSSDSDGVDWRGRRSLMDVFLTDSVRFFYTPVQQIQKPSVPKKSSVAPPHLVTGAEAVRLIRAQQPSSAQPKHMWAVSALGRLLRQPALGK